MSVVDVAPAVQGWDSGPGGVLHVLGAIGYGIVVLRFATWVGGGSWLTTGLLLAAVVGAIGIAVAVNVVLLLALGASAGHLGTKVGTPVT